MSVHTIIVSNTKFVELVATEPEIASLALLVDARKVEKVEHPEIASPVPADQQCVHVEYVEGQPPDAVIPAGGVYEVDQLHTQFEDLEEQPPNDATTHEPAAPDDLLETDQLPARVECTNPLPPDDPPKTDQPAHYCTQQCETVGVGTAW
ncbi:hypothetical protein GGF32_004479 [Allomyces javanicus]|nr:hypothetical protein GGF32_004479 [Allomyces javanicus]